MVRKKAESPKKPNIFAPVGKVIMIQRNKEKLTPAKTPVSHPSLFVRQPSLRSSKTILNRSDRSSIVKSKRKVSQAVKAIREIKKFQSNTKLLIPKAPFSRLVKEVAQKILGHTDIRFTALSLLALQEASEMAVINLLEIANFCSFHAKRVTLMPADIRLTRRAFGLGNPLNA